MWSMDYDSFRPPKKPFPFSSESYASESSLDHLNNAHQRSQGRHGGNHWDDRNHRHHNNRKHFPFLSDGSETESSFTDYTYTSYSPKFEHFYPIQINLPRRSARTIHPDEILILPPTLTRCKISLQDIYGHNLSRSIRVTVAGDMRLRDVIKQVLSPTYLADARTSVKLRGEWNEVGAPVLLSEVTGNGRYAVNERGEVEVRVVLGGGGRGGIRVGLGGGRGGGELPRFGWERGSVERLRVY